MLKYLLVVLQVSFASSLWAADYRFKDGDVLRVFKLAQSVQGFDLLVEELSGGRGSPYRIYFFAKEDAGQIGEFRSAEFRSAIDRSAQYKDNRILKQGNSPDHDSVEVARLFSAVPKNDLILIFYRDGRMKMTGLLNELHVDALAQMNEKLIDSSTVDATILKIRDSELSLDEKGALTGDVLVLLPTQGRLREDCVEMRLILGKMTIHGIRPIVTLIGSSDAHGNLSRFPNCESKQSPLLTVDAKNQILNIGSGERTVELQTIQLRNSDTPESVHAYNSALKTAASSFPPNGLSLKPSIKSCEEPLFSGSRVR